MTIPDYRGLREGRLSEAHEQTVPAGQQGVDQTQLAEAFSRLVAAARAVGLYGEDHPAAISRARAAAESMTRAASHGLQRLAVISASLRSEAGELPQDADLIELGKTLDRMGIAAIELVSPPQDGTVAMAGVLWAAMASPVHLPDFPARVELAGHGVLRMTAVDYKRLKVVEGVEVSVHAPILAELVAATLTGKDIPDDDTSIRELAKKVEASGAAAGLKAEDLAKAIHEAEGTDPARVRKRVGKFVEALSADVRAELLAINPQENDSSIKALGDLASVLPVEEVLGALNRVDNSSRQLCNESAMLFAKLAGLAAHDDSLGDAVREAAASWREKGDSGGAGLKKALDDLLRMATATGFNPADYEAMLAKLSVGFSGRQAHAERTEFEARGVQRHLAVIAGEMTQLTSEVGSAGTAYLLEAMDSLIDQGDLVTLEEALRSAGTTEHGATVLGAIVDAQRVDRIARAAAQSPGSIAAACGLLEHAGARGSAAALLHLADVGDIVARRRTAELVRRHRESAGSLDEHLKGQETRTLVALTTLAALLPPEMLLAMALPRLEAVSAADRDAAICAIGARHGKWPREMILAGLASQSSAVASLAIEQAAGMEAAAGLEILRAYIDGAYGATHAAAIERAASVMAAGGEAGMHAAAELLTRLAFVPSQRAATAAGAIAKALTPFKEDKVVGRALRAMSLSPTRWLGGEQRSKGAA